ncbi:hypothetical protein [Leptospira interrogans]|uniref:hypothetical protein n=1 Tax=Leptospira interrogans TaxID=173 RepID=UPI0007732059|nr:hypothetical protein [Leptospira interrogans]
MSKQTQKSETRLLSEATEKKLKAIEKKGTKVPKGKRKLLLVDNERASRLKINKETVDEFNPTA